ncbi:hypothetical protein ACWEV4_32585 [Streptomyces sp. NPDC003860]
MFGFAALLRKAQAQHAAGFEVFTVFDAENGSQTHTEQDPAYKGQRPAPDPGLMDSLPLVKAALDHAGVRWIEQDCCEAGRGPGWSASGPGRFRADCRGTEP